MDAKVAIVSVFLDCVSASQQQFEVQVYPIFASNWTYRSNGVGHSTKKVWRFWSQTDHLPNQNSGISDQTREDVLHQCTFSALLLNVRLFGALKIWARFCAHTFPIPVFHVFYSIVLSKGSRGVSLRGTCPEDGQHWEVGTRKRIRSHHTGVQGLYGRHRDWLTSVRPMFCLAMIGSPTSQCCPCSRHEPQPSQAF